MTKNNKDLVRLTKPQATVWKAFQAAGTMDEEKASKFDTRVVNALIGKGLVKLSGGSYVVGAQHVAKKSRSNGKAKKELSPCLCGCGALAARNFLQGHDAKLKSWIISYEKFKTTGKGEPITKADLALNSIQLDYLRQAPWMTKSMKDLVC